jgi:integrase
VTTAIADYMVLASNKPSYPAIGYRLAHVLEFVSEHSPSIRCAAIDEVWIMKFRQWLTVKPFRPGKQRKLSTIEASVAQLAAAVHLKTGVKPNFKAIDLVSLNETPDYRADVAVLAAMFRYAMASSRRKNLLNYLRMAVATAARDSSIMDFSVSAGRKQWLSDASVANLNPSGRRQTKKYRPIIPIARQLKPLLDASQGFFIPVESIKGAWQSMAKELNLPSDGQSGMRLIRRSMSTILRTRLGEDAMSQISRFMGHQKASTTDIYALRMPGQLGAVLQGIEAIIDEIEAMTPGAYQIDFTRNLPETPELRIVSNAK